MYFSYSLLAGVIMDPQLQHKRNSNPDSNIQNKNSEIKNPKSKIKSRKKSRDQIQNHISWTMSLGEFNFNVNRVLVSTVKLKTHSENFGRAWTNEGQPVYNKMQTPLLNHMRRDSL